ncbi:MAG: signal peptidase II [Candidatus Pacearchaeota archaeon]
MVKKKRGEAKQVKKAIHRESCIDKMFVAMALLFLIYALDRYTKYVSSLVSGCAFFCMKRSINYGAAFNLLQGFEWTRILLIFVTVIVLVLTAYFYCTVPRLKAFHYGLLFLFAGTLCNMIDRLLYGYVVDWLSFSFLPVPAFNIADISNVAGVIILIIVLLKKK